MIKLDHPNIIDCLRAYEWVNEDDEDEHILIIVMKKAKNSLYKCIIGNEIKIIKFD